MLLRAESNLPNKNATAQLFSEGKSFVGVEKLESETKRSLIEELRNRDKPLLATPDAHGPG